jgi:hypothetical protein
VVESKAVRGDPTADVHANGANLSLLRPDACGPFFTAAFDPKTGEGIDNGLFNGAQVCDNITLPFLEIEDGIADDLTGSVIRDVAATICFFKRDARVAQHVGWGKEIFHVPVAAERDDVRVLDEQKLIGDFAPLALFNELALHCERLGIADASTIAHLHIRH